MRLNGEGTADLGKPVLSALWAINELRCFWSARFGVLSSWLLGSDPSAHPLSCAVDQALMLA